MQGSNLIQLFTVNIARARKRPVGLGFPAYFIVITLAAFGLQISGVSIGRWGVDSNLLRIAVETRGAYGANSIADFAVAFITPFLAIGPFYNGITTIGLAFVCARVSYQLSWREKGIVLFLLFPIFFQLQFVSKESIVMLYVLFIYGLYTATSNESLRLAVTTVTMIVMAYIFRNYYFISIAIASCLFFIRGRLLAPAVVAGIICAGLVESVRTELLSVRYFIHFGVSEEARSLTPLLFTGYEWYDFVGNYFASTAFFIFPLMNGIRIQELYMQIYVICVACLVVQSFRSGNRILASLFTGIVLTFPVFVAELGTFVRHISAVAPLLFFSFFFSGGATAKIRIRFSNRKLSRRVEA